MASSPKGDGPEYQTEAERWRVKAAPWVKDMAPEDRDLILEFIDALDPGDYGTQPGEIGTKSYSTIAAYSQNLRLLAKAAPAPLAELGPAELNAVFSDMDVAKNTLSQRQATARMFYKYHEKLGVDPELITIERPERSAVEPRDLFTREEVDAMHDAVSELRDRAMMDLMLYTGQRVRALLTLKVGDIDVENSRFYLDTSEAGLKGAEGMRPMLVAQGACADWMDNHPASDDPDAYFGAVAEERAAAREEGRDPAAEFPVSESELSVGGRFDAALDRHTGPGKRAGRGDEHFAVHGARVGPEGEPTLAARWREGALELGDLALSDDQLRHALAPVDENEKWWEPEFE